MKRFLFFLSSILIISCSGDDDLSNNSEEVELQEGLVQISIEIELPVESVYEYADLSVSSIFTSEKEINSLKSDAIVFNDDSMELILLTDVENNLVMAGYVNPSQTKDLKMSSVSTAAAIALMHPWSFDLTVEEKQKVYQQMRAYPGFEDYHNQVATAIQSGSLDITVLDSFIEELTQANTTQTRQQIEVREPLVFQIDKDSVITINQNSVSYMVALYDDQEQHLVQDLASGVPLSDRTFGWSDGNWINGDSNNRASVPIPADGEYIIKAKNGLSFDGTEENQQAAYYNMRDLGADVLGIFSTTLRDVIKGIDCMKGVGELLYDGGNNATGLASSVKAYSDGSKSGWLLSVDVIEFIYNRYESIASTIKSCDNSTGSIFSNQFPSIENSYLGKFFAFLSVIEKMENVYNTAGFVTDWVQYKSEIQYCFEKSEAQIENCNFDLKGKWELCLFEQIIFSDSCTGDSYEDANCGVRYYEILDEGNIIELFRTDNSCTYSFSENNFIFTCIEGVYNMSFQGTVISDNLIQGEYKYSVNTIPGCILGNRAELRKY
jgi:hypothetical protein